MIETKNNNTSTWITRDEACDILRMSLTQLLKRRDTDPDFPATSQQPSPWNGRKVCLYPKEGIIAYGKENGLINPLDLSLMQAFIRQSRVSRYFVLVSF